MRVTPWNVRAYLAWLLVGAAIARWWHWWGYVALAGGAVFVLAWTVGEWRRG